MGNWESKELSEGMPVNYVHDGQQVNARALGFKRVEFELEPFSCGRCRAAFRGSIYVDGDPSRSSSVWQHLQCWNFDRKGGRPSMPCIVKTFKQSHALHAKDWEKDLTVLKEAQSWSKKFNGRDRSPIKIEFASPLLYQVYKCGEVSQEGVCKKRNRIAQAKVHGREKVCVEPFLEGDFIKANTNCGYVKKENASNAEFLQVAQAFSHWTWAESDRSLLICDLQGVYESTDDGNRKWKFTDPAIHCSAGQGRFGLTDLGPRGINAFFMYHVCNSICRKLPRPEVVVDPGLPPVGPHTSFSFEYAFVQISPTIHSQEDFANILDHAHSGTCYAHAVATAVRAAERRIVGREIEKHHKMVERLVRQYGTKGVSDTLLNKMLEAECHPRQLHYRQIDSPGAVEALRLGRAVLLTFHLTDAQWTELTLFFKKSPSGILEKFEDLLPSLGDKYSGHGAVIVGHDDQSWKIKNSWGDDFADGGYFKMSKSLLSQCRNHFFDVFWYEHDLNQKDLEAYKKHFQTGDVHSL